MHAHPFVEDFYTPAQKEAEQRSFTRFLVSCIVVVLVVLVVMMGLVGLTGAMA